MGKFCRMSALKTIKRVTNILIGILYELVNMFNKNIKVTNLGGTAESKSFRPNR